MQHTSPEKDVRVYYTSGVDEDCSVGDGDGEVAAAEGGEGCVA